MQSHLVSALALFLLFQLDTAAASACKPRSPLSSSATLLSTTFDLVSSVSSTDSSSQSNTTTSISSSSIFSPAGTASTAAPITLAAQPTITLSPLLAPGVDPSGTSALEPVATPQLWYGSLSSTNTSSGINTPLVRINVTFEYPAVVLDDSANIQETQCTLDILSTSFANVGSYNAAKSTWLAVQGNSHHLILISAASGCSSDGQYIYFVSTSCLFTDKTLSVTCDGSFQAVSQIAQAVGVDFGSVQSSAMVIENPALESTYGCSIPSSSVLDGLPAVYCGPDFDQRLDDELGYYSGEDSDFDVTLAALAPQSSLTRHKRTIERRCFLGLCHVVAAVKHVASAVVSTVEAGVKAVAQSVENAAAAVVSHVETAAEKLADEAEATIGRLADDVLAVVEDIASAYAAIATFLITGEYSNSFKFPLNMGPPAIDLEESPWGNGFNFYTWTPEKGDWFNEQEELIDQIKGVVLGDADPEPSIEFWCVNCGITGGLEVTGSIAFSLAHGLTTCQFALTGNIYAGLFLGLNAFAEWDPKTEYDFLTLGLPGLAIPDIITLGPELSYGISIDLDIQAVGQYLVGASLEWPSLQANLDVIDSHDSSQSGWTPQIHHTVQADGSLTVSSTLGTPITLGFGLNLLNGKYEKEIKLVDTPGIKASLEFDFNINSTDGSVDTTPADGCYGIAWDIGLVNTVVLDLSDIDEGSYTLFDWSGPELASGCIGESLTVATPTSSVTFAPSGQATSAPPPSYPDCSTFSCPDNDQGYCLSNDETFQLQCEIWYSTNQEAMLCALSLGDCVDACTSIYNDTCIMVDFDARDVQSCNTSSPDYDPFGEDFNCFIETNLNDEGPGDSGLMALVKTTALSKRELFERTPSTTAINTATISATTSAASATDSFSAITMRDSTGQLIINPHVNGSIFISAANGTTSLEHLTGGVGFVADETESVIMGDSIGRLLYYFPTTMSVFGASRLRLGAWGAIPETAELITLLPWKTSKGPDVLVAMNSDYDVFQPFVCGIQGQLNKVFLVRNGTTGAADLMNPDLTYTVTGGVPQQCLSLAIVAEDLPGFSVKTPPP